MVPHTRRRLLQTAVALTGGLAGCSQLTTDTTESTASEVAGRHPDEPAGDAESDPPVAVLRADTTRPPLALGDPETESREPGRSRYTFRGGHGVIDSQSEAERLTVAPGLDSDPVTTLVDETDFDEATLYLETRQTEACFRLQLCEIRWQPDEIDTSYVRQIRSWDERCSTDESVLESRLVRIPATLDADSVTGHGSSVSSGGSCDDRRVGVRHGPDDGSSSGDSGAGGGSE